MENKKSILAIAGRFKDAGMMPHIHQSYSIGFFYSGKYRYRHGKKEAVLKSGQTRVISPYEVHETYSGEWSYIHLDIDSNIIKNYMSEIYQKEIDEVIKLKPLYDNRMIFESGKNLYLSLNKSPIEQEYALSSFLEILLYANDRIVNQNIDYTKADINRALEYILQNFQKSSLKIEEVAKVLGMSTYYFARSFKKYFGITVHQYIMSLRVERVKHLMHKSDLSLSEIAYECGFSDQSHMIKIFKRIIGKTPTSFYIK